MWKEVEMGRRKEMGEEGDGRGGEIFNVNFNDGFLMAMNLKSIFLGDKMPRGADSFRASNGSKR